MNNVVKATVEQCPKLELQINKGERHRIIHSGIRSGSLWITPRLKSYCVCPTGEVETLRLCCTNAAGQLALICENKNLRPTLITAPHLQEALPHS